MKKFNVNVHVATSKSVAISDARKVLTFGVEITNLHKQLPRPTTRFIPSNLANNLFGDPMVELIQTKNDTNYEWTCRRPLATWMKTGNRFYFKHEADRETFIRALPHPYEKRKFK